MIFLTTRKKRLFPQLHNYFYTLSANWLVPLFLILLCSMVNFVSSVYEENVPVDTAMDIMSKTKPRSLEESRKPLDCSDLYKMGYNKSGVYTIYPISRVTSYKPALDVYCDMTGGGWTVIQRRGDFGKPQQDFYLDWKSYKTGFGDLQNEFWLGNDNIFAITNQKVYSVYFALETRDKDKIYAHYDTFWIDDEFNNYTLHISEYTGNAGDSMKFHNELKFSTKDRKNDNTADDNIFGSCATQYKTGWWLDRCFRADLNGLNSDKTRGMYWIELDGWSYLENLLRSEIKIKADI